MWDSGDSGIKDKALEVLVAPDAVKGTRDGLLMMRSGRGWMRMPWPREKSMQRRSVKVRGRQNIQQCPWKWPRERLKCFRSDKKLNLAGNGAAEKKGSGMENVPRYMWGHSSLTLKVRSLQRSLECHSC